MATSTIIPREQNGSDLLHDLMLFPSSQDPYIYQQGVLRYKGLFLGEKTYLREHLLEHHQDSPIGGHSGVRGTYRSESKNSTCLR